MLKNKTMQSGFTLIELMVVVGIIAILAAIAYPTYQNFIIRGHIESARGEMMENIRMMEEHYAQKRTMCNEVNSDGTCKNMPTAIENPQADTYNTVIKEDLFSGNKGGSYIIMSQPNKKSKFSDDTINQKEVHLLYYSNGSGFVKCNVTAATQAVYAKSAKDEVSGCTAL